MGRWESGIQAGIMKMLKKKHIKAINVHGGPFMEAGTPDIIACVGGLMWLFEVKNENGELSKIQIARLNEWHSSGAMCCVVRDVKEAEWLLLIGRGNWPSL